MRKNSKTKKKRPQQNSKKRELELTDYQKKIIDNLNYSLNDVMEEYPTPMDAYNHAMIDNSNFMPTTCGKVRYWHEEFCEYKLDEQFSFNENVQNYINLIEKATSETSIRLLYRVNTELYNWEKKVSFYHPRNTWVFKAFLDFCTKAEKYTAKYHEDILTEKEKVIKEMIMEYNKKHIDKLS